MGIRIAGALAGAVVALWGAAVSAQTERFVGTAAIADQPPIPVHVELRVDGAEAVGEFTIQGAVFRARGTVAGDDVAGRFEGDGVQGEFKLTRRGDLATGAFVHDGAPGVFDLKRTEAGAKDALGPPPQTLELTAEQWRQDLDALVGILTREHGSPFHRVSREAFEAEAARVRAGIPALSGPGVAAAFRKLSMMIGDGHTGVDLPLRQPRYPLRTFWFDDGLRVVETMPEHRRLLGAKVEVIDGVPFEAAAARLRPYSPMGENAWSWRAVLPFLVNRPAILQHAGLVEAGRSSWTFLRADGRRETVALEPGAFPLKERVRLGDAPPLWEQRPDEPFWSEYWADSGTLYVNFRSYGGLAQNAAALAQSLDDKRPRRLVLDMRDNGGGDYTRGRELLLPVITERPWLNRRDRLFVLVGRHTFSAAMSNAADLRWKTNATLVGEPIGEKPNSWQESRRFHLPNSGLPVTVSTRFYRFAPDGVEAIEPHVRAEPRWTDWSRGRDTAVAAVLGGRQARR